MSTSAEDVYARWPALKNAMQPPRLPIVSGSWNFNPAVAFREIAKQVEAGTFRLRAPESRLDRLVGPFRGVGTCLAPVLQGHLLWIDPEIEPADGDFVIVCLDPEERAGIIERGKKDPGWLATYGPHPGRIVTKILKASGSTWYLFERETCFELSGFTAPRDNRVLGVVRAVLDPRSGRFLFDAPEAHAITQNAATDIYSGALLGPTTTGTQTGVLLTVAVPSVGTNHTAIVTMTGDFWKSNGAAIEDIWMERDTHGSITGGIASEVRYLGATASPGERVTIQYEFSNLSGYAYDYNLQFNTNSPSNTITAENVRTQVEIIKR